MDNITVEVGAPDAVRVGDTVTLIGENAGARITAESVARRLGTINYEAVCTIGPRVPRAHHRDGVPLDG
jgi:alanine racemase